MTRSARAREAEALALRRRQAVWLAIGKIRERAHWDNAGRRGKQAEMIYRGAEMKIARLMDWLEKGGRGMLPECLREVLEECKGEQCS